MRTALIDDEEGRSSGEGRRVVTTAARVRVVPFPGHAGQHADPGGFHLRVRQWQVDTVANVFGDGLLGSQYDLGRVYEYYVRPGGGFWYAEHVDDGHLLGIVGLRRDPAPPVGRAVPFTGPAPRTAELKRFAVDPAWHNLGIGKRLLAALLDTADRDLGLDEIHLATGPKEHAKPIYERFGFVVTGLAANGDYVMRRHHPARVPASAGVLAGVR
jgi:GNAT superfamily N-acetyltransferase